MKKLAAFVVLGGIAAAVAYKLKKNQEEKEYLDHELDMLSEEETCSCEQECSCEKETCTCEEECACDQKEEPCACSCEEKQEEPCTCENAGNEEKNPVTDEMDQQFKEMLENQSDSVIAQLTNEEDTLEEERPIQHFVDFKSNEDMEAFKRAVIEKGYVVTRGENPLQLSVLHIAPINRSELLVNVYYLANQALKFNGNYQGWQSRKVL